PPPEVDPPPVLEPPEFDPEPELVKPELDPVPRSPGPFALDLAHAAMTPATRTGRNAIRAKRSTFRDIEGTVACSSARGKPFDVSIASQIRRNGQESYPDRSRGIPCGYA